MTIRRVFVALGVALLVAGSATFAGKYTLEDLLEKNAWQDPETGLVWHRTPTTGVNYGEAVVYCDYLDLLGFDDWRLPTIDELRTLVRGCPELKSGGACKVTAKCADKGKCFAKDACSCGAHMDNSPFMPQVLHKNNPQRFAAHWSTTEADLPPAERKKWEQLDGSYVGVWTLSFSNGKLDAPSTFSKVAGVGRCVLDQRK